METQSETNPNNNSQEIKENSGIGTGRKIALYGCGFFILAFVIGVIGLFLAGAIPPYELGN